MAPFTTQKQSTHTQSGGDTVAKSPAQDVGATGPMGRSARGQSEELNRALGPGEALPAGLQARFAASMGADLSDVRVHSGPEAIRAAKAAGARAFATGRHIVLGAAEAGGPEAELLLAHEAVHMVQQGTSGATPQRNTGVSSPGDPAEHEAERLASAVVSGQPEVAVPREASSPDAIQRWANEPDAAAGREAVRAAARGGAESRVRDALGEAREHVFSTLVYVEVTLPSGTFTVHVDDLDPLIAEVEGLASRTEPAREAVSGRSGSRETAETGSTDGEACATEASGGQIAPMEGECAGPEPAPPTPEDPVSRGIAPDELARSRAAYLEDLRTFPPGGTGDQVAIRLVETGEPTIFNRAAAEALRAREQSRALDAELEFSSRIESIISDAGARHPTVLRLAQLLRDALLAHHVYHRDEDMRRARSEFLRITGNLRETVRALGDQAPNRAMWTAEEMVYGSILGDLDRQIRMATVGGYGRGGEQVFSRSLRRLDDGLLHILAPDAARGRGAPVGASPESEFRVCIGAMVVPGAVLTAYLKIKTSPHRDGGGTAPREGMATPSVEIDEDGELTGEFGVSGTVRSGGSTASHSADDSTIAMGVSADSDGFSAEHTVTDPSGWSRQFRLSPDGVACQIRHSSGAGAELATVGGHPQLSLLMPQIQAGALDVEVTLEIEAMPATLAFARSATQTVAAQQAFRQAMLVYAGIALAPVAAVVAAEAAAGTAAALGGAEAGGVLLQFGARALAFAP